MKCAVVAVLLCMLAVASASGTLGAITYSSTYTNRLTTALMTFTPSAAPTTVTLTATGANFTLCTSATNNVAGSGGASAVTAVAGSGTTVTVTATYASATSVTLSLKNCVVATATGTLTGTVTDSTVGDSMAESGGTAFVANTNTDSISVTGSSSNVSLAVYWTAGVAMSSGTNNLITVFPSGWTISKVSVMYITLGSTNCTVLPTPGVSTTTNGLATVTLLFTSANCAAGSVTVGTKLYWGLTGLSNTNTGAQNVWFGSDVPDINAALTVTTSSASQLFSCLSLLLVAFVLML